MAEKTPKRRIPETGGRQGMHGNDGLSDDILAGISMHGLGEQASKDKRGHFKVQSQKVDPRILEVALDLAGNDTQRLEFNEDGSVTVKNNPD